MSKLPSTGPSLARHIRQQDRQALRQAQSSAFNRSGTSVTAEGVTEVEGELDVTGVLVVDGSETVTGPLAVHGTAAFDGNTTIGGTLDVGAATTIDGTLGVNGAMTITGTLSLPAGIINNAALTSPIYPLVSHVDAQGFAVTAGANVEKIRTTISVPSGYTRALVYATSTLSAINSTSAWDDMYLGTLINGVSIGWAAQISVANGSIGSATEGRTSFLTGIGSSFYVSASTASWHATWAADAANTINLDVMVIFLR